MLVRKVMLVVGVICVVVGSVWAVESIPQFAGKPTVTKEEGRFKIEFAVKDYCDVTLAVVNAEGKTLRHLVSGVLGRNPPAPLRKNSLKQVLYWNGKDDFGKPAPAGSKVRIALGLKPEFERILLGEKPGLRGPISAACAPDGTLYVADITELGNISVRAFDRQGNYLRTVLPFPANMKAEHLNGLPLWKTDAGLLPIFFRGIRGVIYPFLGGGRSNSHNDLREGMAVSSDGRIAMVSRAVGVARSDYRQFLLRFRTDGSVPQSFVGPPLLKSQFGSRSFDFLKWRIELAFSPEEKSLFISSLYDEKGNPGHAVCKVGWDDRDLPKVFVGDPAVPGNDEKHLNDPRGIAVGPGGNLYVADWGNDRIAVFDPKGAFIRAIPIDTPDQVAVHPKTGAIYVLCWAGKDRSGRQPALRKLVKLSPEGSAVAEMTLPGVSGQVAETGLVLDPAADPPILWVTNATPRERLRKVVDKGASLEVALTIKPDPENPWVQSLGTTQIAGPAVDRKREEVYVRILRLEPGFHATGRIDGRTGKVEQLDFPVEVVGPDGNLYGRRTVWPLQFIGRYSRDGKAIPFPAATEKGIQVPTYGDNATHWLCDFTVAPNGDLYLLRRSEKGDFKKPYDTARQVDVYGPDGSLKLQGLVTGLSNGASDIEVDRDGAIYVLEHIKRKDEQVPAWASGIANPLSFVRDQLTPYEGYRPYPPDPRGLVAQEWGALLKFEPSGGKVDYLPANQFEGCDYIWEDGFLHKGGVSFEGLVWLGPGASRVVAGGCRCYSGRFDQDGWARSFVPQTHRFCVGVVDKAGNEITRIGSYGNFDSAGPDSAVPVPDIPLWWPNWLGVSDTALYIADNANLRLLKVRLNYHTEETVEIR